MEQRILEYLANSMWQVPLLAGTAWLVLWVVRPGPRMQHWVWLAVLALAVAMPLRGMGDEPRDSAPNSAADLATFDVGRNAAALSSVQVVEGTSWWRRGREVRLGPTETHWVVGMYLAMVLLAGLRLVRSLRATHRMVADAKPARLTPKEFALLEDCCERLGVARPSVRLTSSGTSPLLVGMRWPVVLLPECLAERAANELEAVWWHEMAHVRRRDYMMNLLCRVAAIPVAYHPATYVIHRRIRQTREMVCDAMAATAMDSRAGYARCLVGLARRTQIESGMVGRGVGMFDGGTLEERVVELVGSKGAGSLRLRGLRLASGAAMMLAAMAGAATLHVTPTMAQTVCSSDAKAASEALPAQPVLTERPGTVTARVEVDEPSARPMPLVASIERSVLAAVPAPAPVTLPEPLSPVAGPAAPVTSPVSPASYVTPAAVRVQVGERSVRPVVLPVKVVHPLNAVVQEPVPGAVPEPVAPITVHVAPVKVPVVPAVSVAPAAPSVQPAARSDSQPHVGRGLTPEERKRIDEQVEAARAAAVEAGKRVNSPEFKKRIVDAQRQAVDAAAKLDSPEFKKKMAEAARQMANVNNPEFKKQMAVMQKEVADAAARMNNPEFRMKIAAAQKAAIDAAQSDSSDEAQRARDEAQRERAQAQKEAQQARDEAQKARDEARKDVMQAQQEAQRERDQAQKERDEARKETMQAQQEAQRARDEAQKQRDEARRETMQAQQEAKQARDEAQKQQDEARRETMQAQQEAKRARDEKQKERDDARRQKGEEQKQKDKSQKETQKEIDKSQK